MATKRKPTLSDVQFQGDRARIDPRGFVRPPQERIRPQRYQPAKELLDFRGLSQTLTNVSAAIGEYDREQDGLSADAFLLNAEQADLDLGRDPENPSVDDRSTWTSVLKDPREDPKFPEPALLADRLEMPLPDEISEAEKVIGEAARKHPELVNPLQVSGLTRLAGRQRGFQAAQMTIEAVLAEIRNGTVTRYDVERDGPQRTFAQVMSQAYREVRDGIDPSNREMLAAYATTVLKFRNSMAPKVDEMLGKSKTKQLGETVFIPQAVAVFEAGLSPLDTSGLTGEARMQAEDGAVQSITKNLDREFEAIRLKGYAGRLTPGLDADGRPDDGLYIRASLAYAEKLGSTAYKGRSYEAKERARRALESIGNMKWGNVKASQHPAFSKVEDAFEKILEDKGPAAGTVAFEDALRNETVALSLLKAQDAYADAQSPNDQRRLAQQSFLESIREYADERQLASADRAALIAAAQDRLGQMAQRWEPAKAASQTGIVESITTLLINGNRAEARAVYNSSHGRLSIQQREYLERKLDSAETAADQLRDTPWTEKESELRNAMNQVSKLGLPPDVISNLQRRISSGILNMRQDLNDAVSESREIPRHEAVSNRMASPAIASTYDTLYKEAQAHIQASRDATEQALEMTRNKRRMNPEQLEELRGRVSVEAYNSLAARNADATDPRSLLRDFDGQVGPATDGVMSVVLQKIASSPWSEQLKATTQSTTQRRVIKSITEEFNKEVLKAKPDFDAAIERGVTTAQNAIIADAEAKHELSVQTGGRDLAMPSWRKLESTGSVDVVGVKTLLAMSKETQDELDKGGLHLPLGGWPFGGSVPTPNESVARLISGNYVRNRDIHRSLMRQRFNSILGDINSSGLGHKEKSRRMLETAAVGGLVHLAELGAGNVQLIHVKGKPTIDATKIDILPIWAGPMFTSSKEAQDFGKNPRLIYQKLEAFGGKTMAEVLGFTNLTEDKVPDPMSSNHPTAVLFRDWITHQSKLTKRFYGR